MLASVSAVQTADHMYSSVYSVFSLAQAHFANQIISMQNTYRRIDASLREVRSSGQNDVRLTAIKSAKV
jgi:hypothetical protein